MTPDLKYAKACNPDPRKVIGVSLRPFCIGHAILLQSVDSPFVSASGKFTTIPDLLLAVWICSQSFDRASGQMNTALGWRWKFKSFVAGLVLALNWKVFSERVAQFESYLAAQNENAPHVWNDSKMTRASTAPGLLLLKRDLVARCGFTESEALNMPLAKAKWERAAWMEAEGACDFRTDQDEQLLKMAQEEAAKEFTQQN